MKDDRLDDPRMDYYKEVFKDSIRWHQEGFRPYGPEATDKRVIVYGEQGFGDIIQFARYIPVLKEKFAERNFQFSFYVPKDLHRLFECLGVTLLDKDDPNLPDHDFHVLAMDLPFLLQVIDVKFPYLTVNETAEVDPVPEGVKRIGIAWEGNPNHTNSEHRDCPLKYFKCLDHELIHLYMLQKEAHDPRLLEGAEDMNLYGYEIKDFYDTAKLINAMDAVVTVDTSVLHLAGAMNKLTYALLPQERDPRWDVHNWYHSVVFIKQNRPSDWTAAFIATIKMMTGQMFKSVSPDEDVLNQVLS